MVSHHPARTLEAFAIPLPHAAGRSGRTSTRRRRGLGAQCCASMGALRSAEAALSTLHRTARPHGVDAGGVSTLLRLTDLLLSESKRYNLTAIRTCDAVVLKHVVDGLSLLGALDAEAAGNGAALRVMDVGSGAGFPGLVVAAARPRWEVTLLEAARKKTRFHEMAMRELGVRNVRSLWGRAEEVGRNRTHRERYDVATARAVAEMRVCCELCLPLVRVGGAFLAQKSVAKEMDEVRGARRAMEKLGGRLERVCDAGVGRDEDGRVRSVVVVRKTAGTGKAFPRLPGVPKKTPL